MKLERLSYSQHLGGESEWGIEPLDFEEINLFVGRNASGKTRTLNVIKGLSQMLAGEVLPNYKSGQYLAQFTNEGKQFEYTLEYEDSKVIKEVLKCDEKLLLDRGVKGLGILWAEKENKNIDFQTPDTQLASVARRDSIQHSFFEPLFQWGKSVSHYSFGSDLGKNKYGFLQKEIPQFDPRDASHLLRIFRTGKERLGDKFLNEVYISMGKIGYDIEGIGLMTPVSVNFMVEGPSEKPVGLYVKEKNLKRVTDQNEMSQGMFRALATVILITYAKMAAMPSCVLIDDIGEGLDYERSCALIDLLMNFTTESHIQLIMSTNDRFIMNKVPLKSWTVLQRTPSKLCVFNSQSSHGFEG